MECAHCVFSCKPSNRTFLDFKYVKKAIDAAAYYGNYITLGGGEPTLHPDFMRILKYALKKKMGYILVVTNGTQTEIVWDMVELQDCHENLNIELSTDEYHALYMVDDRILSYFKKHKQTRHVKKLIPQGRAKEYGIAEDSKHCSCDTLFINANGGVYFCGCANAPKIGNVASRRFKSAVKYYFETCSESEDMLDNGNCQRYLK